MKLRSHLALLVLAALVPALVFSGVLLGIVHRHTRAAVERGLMDTARALSLTVDHELQATIRTLRALGATPSLARDDLRRFHEAARAVLATQECWDNIVLFDPSARELVNLRRPFGESLPHSAASNDILTVVATRAPVISNMFAAPLAGRSIVRVLVPVGSPAPRYTLSAVFKADAFSEMFREQKFGADSIITLLDRNKIIVGRSRAADRFVGQRAPPDLAAQMDEITEGTFRGYTKEGQVVYAAISRSASSGWTIAAGVPAASTDAPLRTSSWLLIGAGAVFGGVAIFLSGVVGRRLARSIGALSTVAAGLASGRAIRIGATSVAEVNNVARAIEEASEERQQVERDHVRLLDETERRRRAAEAAAEVGRVLSQTRDPASFSQRMVEIVCDLLGLKSATLFLLDPPSGALVVTGVAGSDANNFLGSVFPAGTGIVGLAARERAVLQTPNFVDDPRVVVTPEQRAQAGPHRAILAVPLLIQDRVIGVLALRRPDGERFSGEEVRVATTFCDHTALALDRARLDHETAERLRQTERLLAVSQAISSTLDLGEVLREAIRSLAQALRADVGGVLMFSEDGQILRPVAGYHIPPEFLNRLAAARYSITDPTVAMARDLTAGLYAEDSQSDPRFARHPWTAFIPHRSIAILPIRAKDTTRGLFVVVWTSATHAVTAEEDRLAEGITRQVAVGLENLELLTQLKARQARLEALLEANRQLSTIQPREELLARAAAASGTMLDCAAVRVRFRAGDVLVAGGAWGDAGEDVFPSTPLPIAASLAGSVAVTGEARIVAEPANHPLLGAAHREAFRRLGRRQWMGVPIKVSDQVLGVLSALSREDQAFSFEDLAVAQAIAAQVATALDNTQLYQEVRTAYEEVSRMQATLVQAQKMEAIGRFAGGVAHDFNNLLTIITGRASMLGTRLGANHPLTRHATLISSAADRAASLTRQLLAFGRKQVLQPRVLDLNALVKSTSVMLQRLIGEHIELVTQLGAEAWPVKADSNQLELVLMNLAVNARDAMSRGGRITLATANVEVSEAQARDAIGFPPGPYVTLIVGDTGTGMIPEVIAHIFEPFFTTKGVGEGTGLGLSTVYGIVEQSGGHIAVESTPGLGTTFTIYLPRTEAEALATTAEAPREGPAGSETILLVEDEVEVRSLLKEVLETGGYKVFDADGAAQALDLAKRLGPGIDLLVTDVIMPRMSGPQLARRLLAERPDLKVLYMSGYTDGGMTSAAGMSAGAAFLQKPVTPDVFARTLREMLDRRAQG